MKNKIVVFNLTLNLRAENRAKFGHLKACRAISQQVSCFGFCLLSVGFVLFSSFHLCPLVKLHTNRPLSGQLATSG